MTYQQALGRGLPFMSRRPAKTSETVTTAGGLSQGQARSPPDQEMEGCSWSTAVVDDTHNSGVWYPQQEHTDRNTQTYLQIVQDGVELRAQSSVMKRRPWTGKDQHVPASWILHRTTQAEWM